MTYIIRISLILLFVINFSCHMESEIDHNKNPNNPNMYLKYISPLLKEKNISNYEGRIFAIANDDCRKCSNWVLENCSNFKNMIIIYDSTVYNYSLDINCSNFIKINNDRISRINFPNEKIYGHRLYWIKNDSIIKVKKITPQNVGNILNISKDDNDSE